MEAVNMEEGTKKRKVVVVVDESKEGMRALSWCLHNLVFQNATDCILTLLFVKPSQPVYPSLYAAEYLFSDDIRRALDKHGSDLVNSVMKRAESVLSKFGTDVKVETMVGIGDAKNVICDSVEKLKADILIMGGHGHGFYKRTLLGSVSEHCTKNIKCSLVIVNSQE